MGTWGTQPFENDGALDWLAELEEADGLSVLEEALEPDEDEGYLDATDAEFIVCAAEIIAAGIGRPGASLPEGAAAWVAAHPEIPYRSLVAKARSLVGRVLEPESELRDLWEENQEDFPVWHAAITDLKSRLEV